MNIRDPFKFFKKSRCIAREANTGEVQDLRREARDLKEVVAEQTLELRLLKKSVVGALSVMRASPAGL
jgi:hypothetical protein